MTKSYLVVQVKTITYLTYPGSPTLICLFSTQFYGASVTVKGRLHFSLPTYCKSKCQLTMSQINVFCVSFTCLRLLQV